MAHIYSRVNGLRIGIPADARNIVHRFAIGGGGNELIFEPLRKSDYDQSKRLEGKPVEMGSIHDTHVPSEGEENQVELSVNVVEDEEVEPKAAKPSRSSGRQRKAAPAKKAAKKTTKQAATKDELEDTVI